MKILRLAFQGACIFFILNLLIFFIPYLLVYLSISYLIQFSITREYSKEADRLIFNKTSKNNVDRFQTVKTSAGREGKNRVPPIRYDTLSVQGAGAGGRKA